MVSLAHRHDVAPFSGEPPVLAQSDETIQITEAVLKFLGTAKLGDENVNIQEIINKVLGYDQEVDETEDIQEGVLKFLGTPQIVNESVDIAESIIEESPRIEVVNEMVDISELVNESRPLIRIANEFMVINEGVLPARLLAMTVDEAQSISEAVVDFPIIVKIINEALDIASNANSAMGLVRVAENEIIQSGGVTSSQGGNYICRDGHAGIMLNFTTPTRVKSISLTMYEIVAVTSIDDTFGEIRTGITLGTPGQGTLHAVGVCDQPNPSVWGGFPSGFKTITFDNAPYLIGEVWIGFRTPILGGIVTSTINAGFNPNSGSIVYQQTLAQPWASVGGYYVNYDVVESGESTVGISEALDKSAGLIRQINEFLAVSEDAVASRALIRIVSEILNIDEVVASRLFSNAVFLSMTSKVVRNITFKSRIGND